MGHLSFSVMDLQERHDRELCYLIGPPGAGKTTAALRLLEEAGFEYGWSAKKPFHHEGWRSSGGREIIVLGEYIPRSPFSGTDRLSMSVNPTAIRFVTDNTTRLIFGEGDRLANYAFLTEAAKTRVVTVYDLTHTAARDWSGARAARLNVEPQSMAWWKGRATKAANLTARLAEVWAGTPNRVVPVEPAT